MADLIAQFGQARKQPADAAFQIADVTLDGSTKRSIVARDQTRLTHHVTIPKHAVLRLAVAAHPSRYCAEHSRRRDRPQYDGPAVSRGVGRAGCDASIMRPSRLQAYFPGTTIPDEWSAFSEIVTHFYAMEGVAEDRKPEMAMMIGEKLSTLSGTQRREVEHWGSLKERILEERARLIQRILGSKISVLRSG